MFDNLRLTSFLNPNSSASQYVVSYQLLHLSLGCEDLLTGHNYIILNNYSPSLQVETRVDAAAPLFLRGNI